MSMQCAQVKQFVASATFIAEQLASLAFDAASDKVNQALDSMMDAAGSDQLKRMMEMVNADNEWLTAKDELLDITTAAPAKSIFSQWKVFRSSSQLLQSMRQALDHMGADRITLTKDAKSKPQSCATRNVCLLTM